MNFNNGNLDSSPVSLEDFGLGDSIGTPCGNKKEKGIADFWSGNKSADSVSTESESEDSITQEEFQEYLAFKKAKEGRDFRALLELGQIDPSDAYAQLPALSRDDSVQSLHSEVERLKQQLAEVGQWKSEKQKAEEYQQQRQQYTAKQSQVKELLDSDKFQLIDKYDHFQTVWDAGKRYAEQTGKSPTKRQWQEMARDVENSLRREVRQLREADIPLDELDLESVFGAPSDNQNAPQKPASNAYQGLNNRPTIRNSDASQTAPKSSSNVDMSVEARRERAMKALAALRR